MDFIESELFREPALRHGFFTRRGGVSAGIYASLNAGLGSSDSPDNVRQNRSRIAAALGVAPDHLVSMHQTHSASVLAITEPMDARPRVDALVSDRTGLALGVLHADCTPVLFADVGAGVIGAAHAGWRSAAGGILEATLDAMASIGARREHTIASLGPTIAQPSYEVGPEFPAPIINDFAEAAACFTKAPEGERYHFDLPQYVVMRLERAGVGAIDNLALDTYTDEERFFSYRRATHRGEADYGRLLSAVCLEG